MSKPASRERCAARDEVVLHARDVVDLSIAFGMMPEKSLAICDGPGGGQARLAVLAVGAGV